MKKSWKISANIPGVVVGNSGVGMLQMGLVAVVMVMAVAVMVVAQLKGHKKSILQTLYHSWVLQIYLLAFHYNIVV